MLPLRSRDYCKCSCLCLPVDNFLINTTSACCSAFKYLHIALQTAAGIFILMGLIFVGLFKRYNGEAQFFSIHSWLGAIATAMYIAQYTAGDLLPLPWEMSTHVDLR